MGAAWDGTTSRIVTVTFTLIPTTRNQMICGNNPARVGLWFPYTPDHAIWPYTNNDTEVFTIGLDIPGGLLITYRSHGPIVTNEWYTLIPGSSPLQFIETVTGGGSPASAPSNQKSCWVFKDGIWQRQNNAT